MNYVWKAAESLILSAMRFVFSLPQETFLEVLQHSVFKKVFGCLFKGNEISNKVFFFRQVEQRLNFRADRRSFSKIWCCVFPISSEKLAMVKCFDILS